MRAGGGGYQLFSFSLSFPAHTAVRQAALNISSYFILQPAINIKLFSSHLHCATPSWISGCTSAAKRTLLLISVRRGADGQFSARNPSHVPINAMETCWFLQAPFCIIWFNFMYHKTVIMVESIMLLLFPFLSLVSPSFGVTTPSQLPASCFHPDMKLLIVSEKRLDGCELPFRHTDHPRGRLVWSETCWEQSAPLLSIGLFVSVRYFNPPGVISASVCTQLSKFLCCSICSGAAICFCIMQAVSCCLTVTYLRCKIAVY